MEFASLEDAYSGGFSKQGSSSEKKKTKRSKEAFQAYELPPTDPDRPAMKRLMEVPPMKMISEEDAVNMFDESTLQKSKFTMNNSLPSPRLTTALETGSLPKYFGAEAFTNPSDDTKAPYSTIARKNGYMLDADFTHSFEQQGFGKSAGQGLPTPELSQRWKPLSSGKFVDTSFTNTGRLPQSLGLDMSDMTAMKSKLDSLMARLDDLENRAAGANPQLEMLLFIMTGLFLMFGLDVAVRKSSGMRLLNVR